MVFFHDVLHNLDRKAALTGNEDSKWKAIFNNAVETLDEADLHNGLARCCIKSHLIMEIMIKSWLGRFRCFFDFYIGELFSLVSLHNVKTERLSFPICGGRFLLTGRDFPAQHRRNYFDHHDGTGPGLFIIAKGEDEPQFRVADFHKHVNLAAHEKMMKARFI